MESKGFSQFRNLDPEDYYLSDEGYIVYTEKYHLKRGYCCQNGCKHCPYDFKKRKKSNT
ncbi:MAG: DUF5522 domain-containing protein [Flavobacteriales bacterium]|nr:DUF5522 domain-containing protein [Flavobacteriales bacterium]MDG1396045.1 DUF5522 domain-containing protein [Flavobacteriales bacterium]